METEGLTGVPAVNGNSKGVTEAPRMLNYAKKSRLHS